MEGRYFLLMFFVLGFSVVSSLKASKTKFFDEYLLNLERRQQAILVEQIPLKNVNPILIQTRLLRSKEDQCCMLGRLAGEKGFYCVPRFYEPRILQRNYNRPHIKNIPSLMKGKPDPVIDKLMKSFSQCVTTGGYVFKKCCRYATLYGS